MSVIHIFATSLSKNSVGCNRCSRPATRVELDAWHNHDSSQHQVLCETCASGRQFEQCDCCEMSDPFECQNDEGVIVYLMPVYIAGELDESGGCCWEHP